MLFPHTATVIIMLSSTTALAAATPQPTPNGLTVPLTRRAPRSKNLIATDGGAWAREQGLRMKNKYSRVGKRSSGNEEQLEKRASGYNALTNQVSCNYDGRAKGCILTTLLYRVGLGYLVLRINSDRHTTSIISSHPRYVRC